MVMKEYGRQFIGGAELMTLMVTLSDMRRPQEWSTNLFG